MIQTVCKKNCSNAIFPSRCVDNTFGYQLYSVNNIIIKKKSIGMIPTGIRFEASPDLVMLIIGQTIKIGISLFEIKREYIGSSNDIVIKLENLSNEDVEIHPRTMISKCFILKSNSGKVIMVNNLEETVRGEKGFGSSGMF